MISVAAYWIRNNSEIMNAYVFLYFWIVFFWLFPKLEKFSCPWEKDLTSTFSYNCFTVLIFLNIYWQIEDYIERYPWSEPSSTIPFF